MIRQDLIISRFCEIEQIVSRNAKRLFERGDEGEVL